ncbi:MAG: DUF2252 domain-containing protein [Mycobacterium sp.]
MVLRSTWLSKKDARERGRALIERVDHDAHAECALPDRRPTVEEFLAARNTDRLQEVLALGHGRMSASPFAFFRGSAGLMAHDLADDPVTGVHGQICGDAHAANFGLYGTHDGRIIMDINDFDETLIGPWEWDVKRLATSLVLAGCTGATVGDKVSRKAARHAARAYRKAMEHLAEIGFLESWSAMGDESAIERAEADELFDDFAEAATKAAKNNNERLASRILDRTNDDHWHFVADPPILTLVSAETKRAMLDALPEYYGTLRRAWQPLALRFRPRDAAMRIVGTGSVGMRAYVVLMQGNGDEVLVLQVKQAGPSALSPYLPAGTGQHEGQRIVLGARLVQAETDPFLGWTTIEDRPYIVRQFRNRKGSIDATLLSAGHLDDYARLAGALLARAHSRSIDPRVLAAYLKDGRDFDTAIEHFAMKYAEQVHRDHADMIALIRDGRIEAGAEPGD